MKNKILQRFCFCIVFAGILNCNARNDKKTFVDARDNQTYAYVTIGKQVWMAQNLNYDAGDSCWCFNNLDSNCQKYGKLYTWKTAIRSCPSGWHLPDDNEWTELENFIKNNSKSGKGAGDILKIKKEWKWPVDNSRILDAFDKYGFSAIPSGDRNVNGDFLNETSFSYFWTSTDTDHNKAKSRLLYYNDPNLQSHLNYKDFGFSVRCIRDR